ncbi:MAG: family 10 glycosylhydrolase [Planctomycetia bacterium]|nr:family 10 glycosylhydrolase [Planctomycetia bacterium]
MGRVFILLLLFACATPHGFGETLSVRLRISWGGQNPTPCFGLISVDTGSFHDLAPLSVDSENPCATRLASGQIHIQQNLPLSFGGCDVTLQAPPDAVLKIQLATHPHASSPEIQNVPLGDILKKNTPLTLDNGIRLLLKRVPGDSLRLSMEKTQLVFAPGEKFRATLTPALFPATAAKAELSIQLFRARESFEIEQEKKSGVVPGVPTPVEIELPQEEGVYDLVFSLKNRSEGRLMEPLTRPLTGNRFHAKNLLAERRVQLVVLSPELPPRSDPGRDETLVLEIDPAQPRWWERLNQASSFQYLRWKRENAETIGSGDSQITSFSMGPAVELPTASSWEAYPLAVEKMGQPHVLEVEYPEYPEQSLGISILEPNASGAIVPMGIDSGLCVPPNPLKNELHPRGWRKHRVVFWPKSKSPVILLTNRHAQNPAYYGKIRILSLAGLRPMFPAAQKQELAACRRITALFTHPLFPECFSATEMAIPGSDFCVDDWITFYDGTSRLLEYLNFAGYNSTVLAVYSEGSTLYPSARLAPSPRHDSGIFFPGGQDPVRKDVLEMMFRMFSRERMTLIPAMDFSVPIPELETLAEQNPHLRWRNAAGQDYAATLPTLRQGAPYYNILNTQVQSVVAQCVDELISRYSHHPSFGGISLLLRERGFLVLPPPQWGVDPETLQQFARDTNLTLPPEYARQVQYVLGEGLQPWLAWRASRLTLFYKHLASRLAGVPGAKLYLTGTDYLTTETHPELGAQLSGTLGAEEVLLRSGIDIRQLASVPNIVFPRPQRVLPNAPLSESLPDLQWAQTPGTYRAFQSQQVPSCVFYHPPRQLRLRELDAKSPYKPTYTWLASTLPPSGMANQRRFAESLAMMDADMIIDGGWMPCLGQEDSLRETFRIVRQLPTGRFNSAMMSDPNDRRNQPILFRSYSERGMNYAYAVNLSAFPMNGEVVVQASGDAQAPTTVTRLSDGRTTTLNQDARGVKWRVRLEPYQVEGIRFSGPPVMLFDPTANFSGEIQPAFLAQYHVLQERLAGLRRPTLYMGLDNANFESVSTVHGVIPGWETYHATAPEKNGTVELDRGVSRSGNASLHLRGDRGSVGVRSLPFVSSETGRLSAALWMRTTTDEAVNVRFTLEGTWSGGTVRRVALLRAGGRGEKGAWEAYSINVNDLPLTEGMELRLGFELPQGGEVWIDNIQLSDMNFTPREIETLGRMVGNYRERVRRGELVASMSILESFWMRFLQENVVGGTSLPTGIPQVAQASGTSMGTPQMEIPIKKEETPREKVGLPPPPGYVENIATPREIPPKKSAFQKLKDWMPWQGN